MYVKGHGMSLTEVAATSAVKAQNSGIKYLTISYRFSSHMKNIYANTMLSVQIKVRLEIFQYNYTINKVVEICT